MKITKTVEKSDGSVVFQGNISGPELDFVIEIGLNTLLERGALPFAHKDTVPEASFADMPDTIQ